MSSRLVISSSWARSARMNSTAWATGALRCADVGAHVAAAALAARGGFGRRAWHVNTSLILLSIIANREPVSWRSGARFGVAEMHPASRQHHLVKTFWAGVTSSYPTAR